MKARIALILRLVWLMFKQDVPAGLYHINHLQNSSFRIIGVINGVPRKHQIKAIRRKFLREILPKEFLGPDWRLTMVFIKDLVVFLRYRVYSRYVNVPSFTLFSKVG